MTKKFKTMNEAFSWLASRGYAQTSSIYIWNRAGHDAYIGQELGGRIPMIRVTVNG